MRVTERFQPLNSFLVLALVCLSAEVFASSGITYHGRILKSDNTPVSSSTTQFRIQVRSPGAENCLLWEEQQTKDLSSTNGVFTITINDTSEPSLIPNALPFSLERTFSNRTTFTGLTGCNAGTTYNPNGLDGRSLQVSFRELPTDPWEAMPITKVNYTPLALNSVQLEGYNAAEFLKVDPASSYTTLTPANVNSLVDLITGASTVYIKPADALGGDLSGTHAAATVTRIRNTNVVATAPTLNQVLKFNGTNWAPAADDAGVTADASYAAKGVVQFDTNLATSGISVTAGVASLPNTIVGAGPTGGVSTIPVITYDNKGRLTAVTTATVDDTTKLALAGGTMTGPINMGTQNITNATSVAATNFSGRNLVLNDNDTNTVTIRTPTDVTANYILQLPPDDGTSNQVLTTDGAGILTWTSPASGISVTANQAVVANGTGTGLSSFTCAINQVMGFDGAGLPQCQNVTAAGGFVNGGNSFGATATLGTNDNFALNIETNGANKMTILPTGEVGIGTTTPSHPLTIQHNGMPALKINSGNNSEVLMYHHSGGLTWMTNGNGVTPGDLGFFNSGGIGLTEFGNPTLMLKENRNVGIGTTTPNTALDVNGAFSQRGMAAPAVSPAGQGRIYFDSTANKFRVSQNNGAYQDLIPAGGTGDILNGGNTTGAAIAIGTNDNFAMNFETNGTTRMTVRNDGHIGIGVASPGEELTVKGNIMTEGDGLSDANSSISVWDGTNSTYLNLLSNLTTPVIESFRPGTGLRNLSFNTADVGIGTATPTSKLEVKGTTTDNTASGLNITDSAGASKLFVRNDGNVGVGTSSPNTVLDVNGAQSMRGMAAPTVSPAGQGRIYFDSTTNKFRVSQNNGAYQDLIPAGGIGDILNGGNTTGAAIAIGTNDNFALNFETNGTNKMSILSTGEVGIGTASPSNKLHVVGAVADSVVSRIKVGEENASFLQGFSSTNVKTVDLGNNYDYANLRLYDNVGVERVGMYANHNAGSFLQVSTNGANNSADGSSNNYGAAIQVFNPSGVENGIIWNSGSASASPQAAITNSDPYGANNEEGGLKFKTSTGMSGLTTRMTIDSSGNVGIGTTSPNTALDLNGAFSQRGMAAPAVSPAGQGRIYFDSTSNTFKVSQNNGAYADLVTASGTGSGFVDGGNAFSAAATLGTNSNHNLNFETNNTVRMVLDTAGKFAMGQSAVDADVQGIVQAPAATSAYVRYRTPSAGAASGLIMATPSGDWHASLTTFGSTSAYPNMTFLTNSHGALALETGTAGTATEKLRIATNGNVGIGTTNPGTKLDVNIGAAGEGIRLRSGNNAQRASYGVGRTSTELELGVAGASNDFFTGIGAGETALKSTSGKLHIGVGSSAPVMSLEPTLVGINTFYPQVNLDLQGSMQFRGVSTETVAPTADFGRIYYDIDDKKFKVSENMGAYRDLIPAGGTGDILNGGNSFGAAATIGTNDNFGLNFETNGTTRMTIRANGAVGINTTGYNTGNLLNVIDPSTTWSPPAGPSQFNIQNAVSGGSSVHMNVMEQSTGTETVLGSLNFNSGMGFVGTINNKPFYIQTNNASRILIDTSGNVGVGNTDPTSRLDVTGDFNQRGMAAPAVSAAGQGRIYFDSTSNKFRVSQNNGAYTDLVNTMSGFNANQAIVASGAGVATSFTCSVGQVLGFDASGFAVCTNVTASGGFINGGNSFGATAILGTTDNNRLDVYTNNAYRASFTTNGRFGMGTTSARSPIDIFNYDTTVYSATARNTNSYNVDNWTNTSVNNTFAGLSMSVSANGGGNIAYGGVQLVQPNSSLSAGDLAFQTGGWTSANERMRITSAGDVGVGTAAPSAKLHTRVSSSVNSFEASAWDGSSLNYSSYAIGHSSAGITIYTGGSNGVPGDLNFSFGAFENTSSPSIVFKENGNVGIGTTTPTNTLNVVNNGTDQLAIQSTNSGGTSEVVLKDNSGTSRGFFGHTNSSNITYLEATGGSTPLVFYTNSANERMRITPAGNVGIGLTNPGEALEVVGNVKATAFVSTSDRRLKTDIEPIQGLDLVTRLNGVRYKWKSDGRSDVGLIAQEVEEVIPEAVVTDSQSGYKSIKYQNLISPMIEAVKELFLRITRQEKKVEVISRDVASVQQQNAALKVELAEKEKRIKALEEANLKILKRLDALDKKAGKE